MLERLLPEIRKVFRDIPQWGDVGFTVSFNDGEPVSFKYSGAVTQLNRRPGTGGVRR